LISRSKGCSSRKKPPSWIKAEGRVVRTLEGGLKGEKDPLREHAQYCQEGKEIRAQQKVHLGKDGVSMLIHSLVKPHEGEKKTRKF